MRAFGRYQFQPQLSSRLRYAFYPYGKLTNRDAISAAALVSSQNNVDLSDKEDRVEFGAITKCGTEDFYTFICICSCCLDSTKHETSIIDPRNDKEYAIKWTKKNVVTCKAFVKLLRHTARNSVGEWQDPRLLIQREIRNVYFGEYFIYFLGSQRVDFWLPRAKSAIAGQAVQLCWFFGENKKSLHHETASVLYKLLCELADQAAPKFFSGSTK